MIKHKNTSKVNIVLVGIYNRNLGDQVIQRCTEYFVKKYIPFRLRKKVQICHYNFYEEDYDAFDYADMILFVGGGLIKFRQEKFHQYIPQILAKAHQRQIPVFFNATGVEGYDEEDERCRGLQEVLNYSCVKGISVRDDHGLLHETYLTPENRHKIVKAVDPALYCRQIYGMKRDTASNTIGLGVIRSRIFADNGIEQIDEQFQLDLYKEMIELIEQKGYQVKLFGNGDINDHKFARQVLEYAGKEEETYLLPRPLETQELIANIASFKAIVAARMHANIIAYSLGVPSVGLVWNDKLLHWGERIGYSERFLRPDAFEAQKIVDVLLKSVEEGVTYNASLGKEMKRSLKTFVRRYCLQAWHEKKKENSQTDWGKRLVAVGLGGQNFQHVRLNSAEAFAKARDGGFALFETDVRLTTDESLVCVNGWNRANYERLGLDPETFTNDGISYEQLHACRWLEHYKVLDFEDVLQTLEGEASYRLMIDIGLPNKNMTDRFASALDKAFQMKPQLKDRVFVQVSGDYGAKTMLEKGFRMMYYFSADLDEAYPEKLDTALNRCKKYGIQMMAVPEKTYSKELTNTLHRKKIKMYTQLYNRYDKLAELIKDDVDYVGTSYLAPAELNAMIRNTAELQPKEEEDIS